MTPLTICCFKWKPARGHRSQFSAGSVHALRNMVARHYALPHRFVCITDDPTGLEGIETIPLWSDFANLPSPHGGHNPSCYRRLKLFSPEAEALVGPHFVVMDLDTVITGNLVPLFDRPEDFVIWGETHPTSFYNGSLWMLRAGTRTQVWTEFDPKTTPMKARRAGRFGSDQGAIGFILGPGEATWTKDDGVYSYRVHIQPTNALPANARIINFHGRIDPWHPSIRRLPWIQEHYYGNLHAAA